MCPASYTRRAGVVLSIEAFEKSAILNGGTERTATSGRVACFVCFVWAIHGLRHGS